MPSLTLRFDSLNRPLVCVEGKPGLLQQQQFVVTPPNYVPNFIEDFLVDTGAADCVVEEDLIASWHLDKMMPVIVKSGPGHMVSGYEYALSLKLWEPSQPAAWRHETWGVSTVPAGHFKGYCKGLIGMDLLRLGGLQYDGSKNDFKLSWET